MSDEKIILTADEAIALLPEGDGDVHNFIEGGFAIIGADHERSHAEKRLRKAFQIELAVRDGAAWKMNHPICCWKSESERSFYEADMDRVDAFEAAKGAT